MRLNLLPKIMSGFMVMALLLIIVAATALLAIKDMDEAADEIKFSADYDDAIMSTIITVVKKQDAMTDYSLTQEADVLKEVDALSKEFAKNIKRLKTFAKTKEELAAITKLKKAHASFDAVGKAMGSAFLSGNRNEGMALMESFDAVVSEQEKLMEYIEKVAMTLSSGNTRMAGEAVSRANFLLMAISAASVLIALFMGITLARSISKPATALAKAADLMANGDLTQTVDVFSSDEVGDAGRSFNAMAMNIKEIITKLNVTIDHMASASEQIAASSEEMAQGAERQTHQSDQVAAAVEEMSATVLEVAKNSNDASQAAYKAAEVAQSGGDIVTQTIDGMNSISASVQQSARTIEALGRSSDEIGEIIAVIDDIADQTNLLALNAAIEAARAGEQGRGFAVVADEVRKLAERTTKATKEIASMIKTIQVDTSGAVESMAAGTEEVQRGVGYANEAGSSLNQIVEVVGSVNDMIQQIATAAEEQSAASEEISVNVEEVAAISKSTASGLKETKVATQEISKLAVDIQQMVSSFKVK
ncbi:MAG: methyl-accepting chemotaxis protein [Proteobacteria bacterium]|nr:methyl-accepting chemotaxis protein [Pseudomonadota bacterium]